MRDYVDIFASSQSAPYDVACSGLDLQSARRVLQVAQSGVRLRTERKPRCAWDKAVPRHNCLRALFVRY
jgi:hypothetical protein